MRLKLHVRNEGNGTFKQLKIDVIDLDTGEPVNLLITNIKFEVDAENVLPLMTLTIIPEEVEIEEPALVYDVRGNVRAVKWQGYTPPLLDPVDISNVTPELRSDIEEALAVYKEFADGKTITDLSYTPVAIQLSETEARACAGGMDGYDASGFYTGGADPADYLDPDSRIDPT